MVKALAALSQNKWQMRNKPLRQQQTLAVGMLQEDPSCDGVVLNIDMTGGGKSLLMRARSGSFAFLSLPSLHLFDPSYGPVLVVNLAKHCTGSAARKSLMNLLV
jgi:hypothetical protein